MNKSGIAAVGFLTLLFISLISANAEENKPEQSVSPPRHFKEIGGSNYVMFRVGREYLDSGSEDAWYKLGVMQPVVATFDRQKKEDVLAQLQAMHDSGQRKISILIWHDHLTDAQMESGSEYGVYGHVMASNGGHLLPQQEKNLKGLLALIRESGLFNELIFRFAEQGSVWPQGWTEWNETLFQENMDFIISVRQQVCEALQGSGMKLMFDLGAELGGMEVGLCTQYTARVWEEYTRRFGVKDTFGFSIAACPGRIARWINVCDQAGVRPDFFALDLYDYIPEWMPKIIPEFFAAGIKHPQLIVLESYYNDAQELKDLQAVAERYNIEYCYLMQWPLRRGSRTLHYSDVFDHPQYDAYLRNQGK